MPRRKSPLKKDDEKEARLWTFIFGATFIGLGIYGIVTDSALMFSMIKKGTSESAQATRESDPILFWLIVSVELLLGVVMIAISSYAYLRNKNQTSKNWEV
jgi:NADH:ubiquinone oxidoreductase subunit 5 (subunit L)/multisubunit Na+/H+ antiporter MnhA subunit